MKGSILGLLVSALLLGPFVVEAAPISAVTVQMEGAGGYTLPAPLQKRMEKGMEMASKHILLGRNTEEVVAQQAYYERVEEEIGSRLLYGYHISQLTLVPGSTTQLRVQVEPYGDVVNTVRVQVEYGNLSPLAKTLLQEPLEKVHTRAEELLLGASLESMGWLEAAVESALREELAVRLPAFNIKVEVHPGKQSDLVLYLIPQGETIRNTTVSMVSETLPTALFWGTREYFLNRMTELEGLPVAFVSRHVPTIIGQFQRELKDSRAVRAFHVEMQPELLVGTRTELVVHVHSDRYVIRGEGRLDMGKKDRNVSLLVHTGLRIHDKHEIFLQTEFYPEDYSWKFFPSYQYHLTEFTDFTYRYDIRHKASYALLQQRLRGGWYIKAERFFKAHENTFSLGYHVHPYLTAEYIFNNEDHWLRLIGHI